MRLVAALIVFALAACSAAPREPRASPARATSPAELFPDDLDFVVRIDAARIRQNPALAGVVRDLAKAGQTELLASLETELGEASAVWVGTRWMSDGFHGDGVVAIEGASGDRRRRAGRRVAIASPDVDAFERSAGGRGEAALEIVMNGRGVLLATAAEADAVLRVLRTWPDAARLDPPARGLVSFAGRLRGGTPLDVAAPGGTLREFVEGLVGYTGSLEEGQGDGSGGLEVEATLNYASPGDAARAAEHAKRTSERLMAAGGRVGTVAHSVKLTEVGTSVRARATVSFAWLTELH